MKPIIVFDLDETLGDFGELSMLWPYDKVEKSRFANFCHFMNNNTQCYSPWVNKLAQLAIARDKGDIRAIVIYTNNNGDHSWANAIAGHIGVMHNKRIFDAVIGGYSASLGLDQCRSSSRKTYEELCNCLGVNDDTAVVFIDDQEHPGMRHPNVKYVRTKAYRNRPNIRKSRRRKVRSMMRMTRRVGRT